MTNAPYMLNVDCDMYANEADVVRQAMCIFLQKSQNQNHCAFVQFPQEFYDSNTIKLTVIKSVRFLLFKFLFIMIDRFNMLFIVQYLNLSFFLFSLLKLVYGTRNCRNPRTNKCWFRLLPQ